MHTILRRPLKIAEILRWAVSHRESTGRWPKVGSGSIPGTQGDNWRSVDSALRLGLRGLPGGYSLAKLLADRKGVRNVQDFPPYTEEEILAWADSHLQRTGRWPTQHSGPVLDAPGETWYAVQMALSHGSRGLPGGTTLARLLAER